MYVLVSTETFIYFPKKERQPIQDDAYKTFMKRSPRKEKDAPSCTVLRCTVLPSRWI